MHHTVSNVQFASKEQIVVFILMAAIHCSSSWLGANREKGLNEIERTDRKLNLGGEGRERGTKSSEVRNVMHTAGQS